MKYEVTYKIIGTYVMQIEANTSEEAEEKAYEKYAEEADFGDLAEIQDDWIERVKAVIE